MDGADLLALCADNLIFECDWSRAFDETSWCRSTTGAWRTRLTLNRFWRNGKFDPAALEAAVETEERAQSAFDEWQSARGTRTLAFLRVDTPLGLHE